MPQRKVSLKKALNDRRIELVVQTLKRKRGRINQDKIEKAIKEVYGDLIPPPHTMKRIMNEVAI